MPKPKIKTLTSALHVKKSAKSSPAQERAKAVSRARQLAILWKETVPSFRVQDIFLSKLNKRTKNNKKDITLLDKVIEHMKDTPADACSGIWQDKEGKHSWLPLPTKFPKVGNENQYLYMTLILFR